MLLLRLFYEAHFPDLVSRLSSNTLWRGLVYTFYIRAARATRGVFTSRSSARRRAHTRVPRSRTRSSLHSVALTRVSRERSAHSGLAPANKQSESESRAYYNLHRTLCLSRLFISNSLSVTVSRYHTITNQSKHTRLVLRLLPWGHPLAAGLRLYAASYAGSGYRPQPHG